MNSDLSNRGGFLIVRYVKLFVFKIIVAVLFRNLSHYLARITHSNTVRGDVLGYHTTGSDYTTVPNRYSRQNNHICAYPHICAYFDGCAVLIATFACLRMDRVSCGRYTDVWGY